MRVLQRLKGPNGLCILVEQMILVSHILLVIESRPGDNIYKKCNEL